MDNPLITIGLPSYNAEKTIAATICSILSQTYDNWELLIIDDGSIDATINVAKGFHDSRINILFDGENKGISIRLNQAINMAKGKYFCRMDADDISFPTRLEKQVGFLEEHSNVDIVASSVVIFRDDGSLAGVVEVHTDHNSICKHPWRGFYFPHPSWMGKVEWFKYHLYTSNANGAEDQLLLYSTFRNSQFAGITDVLVAYRENNRTFEKMFKRRKIFWRVISTSAIKNGHFIDLLMLLLIQPLKIIADLLNIKFGFQNTRNKLSKISPGLSNSWYTLWVKSNKAVKLNAID